MNSIGNSRNAQEIVPVDNLAPGLRSIYVKRSGWLKKSYGFRYVKLNGDYNLHFALSGRGAVIVDDVEYEMKAGDVFMFFPGHRTEHYDFPGERWEYYWTAIGAPEGMGQALDNAIASTGLTELSPGRSLPADSELWTFIPKLHRRICEGSYGGLFPVSAAWRILEGLAPLKGVCEIPLAERVRNYVDGMEDAIEVKELAERFDVSRSTLHRVFSEAYGEPLKGYIQRRRFERACELLSENGLDVRQAALSAGFSSIQYFCRAFKAQTGMSPGAWRKGRIGQARPASARSSADSLS